MSVILSSLYLAPVEYYAALFHADKAVIEICDTYRKQSYRNRCIIAGANGPLSLSIPIEKPQKAHNKMKDIRIAEHGEWQHLHWNAIVSAYNSTPFFQYFEEDFRPFYERKFNFLHDFNEQLRIMICRFIGIETAVDYSTDYCKATSLIGVDQAENIISPVTNLIDLRDVIDPKTPSCYLSSDYYQVFAYKLGFSQNLSIIDLLFNMGNEARIYLINNPHHSLSPFKQL